MISFSPISSNEVGLRKRSHLFAFNVIDSNTRDGKQEIFVQCINRYVKYVIPTISCNSL